MQIFFDKINNKFFHNRVIPDYNIEIIELFQSSIEKTLYYFFGSSPMVSTPQLTLDILNPDQFTSYINFVGKKMSGSVAFISTKEFANLTAEQVYGDEYRAIIKTRNHAELMGEFVNQIAGYMKCTFDKIGLLCQITIPSSFSGEGNICSFLDKSWVKFNVKVNDCFAVVACRLIYVDPKYLKMVFANGDIDEDPEIVLWR